MLAAALGRHRSHGTFNQLQQCLLDAFAGHVAGNGRVVRLSGNLVDFVDVHDADLGLVHIVIALLQQLLDDIFDVLTHVAGFRQGGRVSNGKRNVEQPCQGLRQ